MAEISGLSFGDGNDLTLNRDELKKELKKTDFKEEKMQTVFEKFFDKKTTDGKLDAQERTAMFDALAQAAKASGAADNLSEEEAQAFITAQGVEDISTADLFGFVREAKALSAAADEDENVDGADDDSDSDTDVDENPDGDDGATVKEEPDNKEKWGKFAEKEGVEMTCRDASGRTQPIQGKFEIVSESYDKNPEQFTITDSSSGKAHKYLFEKTGVDSEGNPVYKCVSMNGVEFEDNAYTLKWSDDGTPELVQTEDQANYGVGLKKKAKAPVDPPAAADPEDPPAAADTEDPPAAADPEDPPADPPAGEVKKEDCRETALKNPMVYYNEATKTHYVEKDGKMVEYRPNGLPEGEKLVQVNADGSFVGEWGGGEDKVGHSVYNKAGQEIQRNFGKSKDKWEPSGSYALLRYHSNGNVSRYTNYDENKKPNYTEDYDTQGRTIKQRRHQQGITYTWKYLNDGSCIIERKDDNGKTSYIRQPKEGDSYTCDKDGNKIEEQK